MNAFLKKVNYKTARRTKLRKIKASRKVEEEE
jgi:hypothetical protein